MRPSVGFLSRALALLGIVAMVAPEDATAKEQRDEDDFRERVARRRAREPHVQSRGQWHTSPSTVFYVTPSGTVHQAIAGSPPVGARGSALPARLLTRRERRALVNVHAWRLLGVRAPHAIGVEALDAIDRAGREAKRKQRSPEA